MVTLIERASRTKVGTHNQRGGKRGIEGKEGRGRESGRKGEGERKEGGREKTSQLFQKVQVTKEFH